MVVHEIRSNSRYGESKLKIKNNAEFIKANKRFNALAVKFYQDFVVNPAIKPSSEFIKLSQAIDSYEIKATHDPELQVKSINKDNTKMKTNKNVNTLLIKELQEKMLTVSDVSVAIETSLSGITAVDNLVQPTFEELQIEQGESVSESHVVRRKAAKVGHSAEAADGASLLPDFGGNPLYENTESQKSVIKAKHTISREAVSNPKLNIAQDIVRGIDEETKEQLELEVWVGVGALGGEPELSGINSIHSDLVNSYAEAVKVDSVRDINIYQVKKSGIDNSIGDANSTVLNSAVNNLIDLVASLPVKLKKVAKFYMEPSELTYIMKLKDTTGQLIFNKDTRLLLGYPVVEIDGFRARESDGSFTNSNDVRIAFGLLSEAMVVKHIPAKDELLLDVYSADGAVIFKAHKTFINFVKNHTALRLLAAKA